MFNELQYYSSALGILAGIAMAYLAMVCVKPHYAKYANKYYNTYPGWFLKQTSIVGTEKMRVIAKKTRWFAPLGFVIEGFLCLNIFQYDSEGSLYATDLIQPCLFLIILSAILFWTSKLLILMCSEHETKETPIINAQVNDFVFHYLNYLKLKFASFLGVGLWVIGLLLLSNVSGEHSPLQVWGSFIPACSVCIIMYCSEWEGAHYKAALNVLLQADNEVLETLNAKYGPKLFFQKMMASRNSTLQKTVASVKNQPS